MFWLFQVLSSSSCHTEKAPNAWQRRGTQKTRNTYNQPNRPNQQTTQTKHQAPPKGQPGRHITPNNTAAVHASAQQQPTISTNTRQGHHQIFSSNLCVALEFASRMILTRCMHVPRAHLCAIVRFVDPLALLRRDRARFSGAPSMTFVLTCDEIVRVGCH